MFDSIAPAPMSRRRQIFFAASGVAHGAAVAALIVAAMWRVDKLSHDKEHVQVAMFAPPPAGNSGGGAPPKATTPSKVTPPRRVRVTTPVQPVAHVDTHEEEPAAEAPPGDGGGGDGKGTGEPELGSGCHDPLGCGVAVAPPPLPEPPKPCSDPSRAADPDCAPPRPTVVPPNVVEHLRISGETQIQPPDDVKIMMGRDGKSRLRASFRVCLDAGGAVTSTTALASTGYGEYDQRLTDAMAGWRYRPYTVDGKALPVCGAVTFIYSAR